jgi:glutamate-ammonia-ligase adenylyltransferase
MPELLFTDSINQLAQARWQQIDDQHKKLLNEAQRDQLAALCALSDYIFRQIHRQPDLIKELLEQGWLTSVSDDFASQLAIQLKDVNTEDELQTTLRHFRHLHMVHIAMFDLLNKRSIVESMRLVSSLADAIINQTYQWLYNQCCESKGTPIDSQGRPIPMIILGMGKLGGKELNYSSDIDLIFTYPMPGVIKTAHKEMDYQQFFARLAQKLITALNQVTADGFVYRVDMRLRPFGESGPLVMHFAALEDYYQTQGREWERYAMLKARIIGDQNQYTKQLRAILQPFVYRRYLDFSVIDSLRSMKQQIMSEYKRRQLHHNIKLGPGGIREVEFFVQCFQLIRGGRVPQLQVQSLLHSVQILAEFNFVVASEAQTLQESYLFLRKVEQCLQQFEDQQTQQLPDSGLDQARLHCVMGYDCYNDFLEGLKQHQQTIHRQFEQLISDASQVENTDSRINQLTDLWLLNLSTDEAIRLLDDFLLESPTRSHHLIAIQEHDFVNELIKLRDDLLKQVGQKGMDSLNSVMPLLLEEIFAQTRISADSLLQRIAIIMRAIVRRSTYLDLLNEYAGARKQLVLLSAASPWIARQIATYPYLLDELIDHNQLIRLPTPSDYQAQIRQLLLRIDPEDLEQQMDALREFKFVHQLKIAAADVSEVLPTMKVSDQLSYLAEAILHQVVELAWQQTTQRHGSPPDCSLAHPHFSIVAYGKLGGWELGYGSDLDLVFLQDHQKNPQTVGEKPIETRRFYLKLAQRIMHIFSTRTRNGILYEMDLRLRPSGQSGLLVSQIDSFEAYQLNDAWIWEHQALVRARTVYGTTALIEQFKRIRNSVLEQDRNPADLKREVRDMRNKMREQLSQKKEGKFDVKQDLGGITDIEFLVQYWVLKHAATYPELTKWSDNVRILHDLEAYQLIPSRWRQQLTQAYLNYRDYGHKVALAELPNLASEKHFLAHREAVKVIWQQTFLDVTP